MPIDFQHKTLRKTLELHIDLTRAQQEKILQLNGLDKIIKYVLHNTEIIQQQRKKWHEKYIKDKKLFVGDWALLYDSLYQHTPGKFQTRWLGPSEIVYVFTNEVMQLSIIDLV